MEHRSPHHLVVLAEDDPEVRRLIGTMLAHEGYATARVTTGWEALAAVERFAPALVVLDADVESPNGIALTQLLKRNPRHSHVPVLLLTTHADSTRIKEALAAGAAGYLAKPLHTDALRDAIASLVPPASPLAA
ncbi:MAG TPA: response regulator [Gaiellaceae bacterium]|nr:response regulator [Gaiellaceae bacterium]